ncbi:hypothetical protein [Thiomicrorhabdus aquaedulcis]|uniref:hypothetical protein n=1 Tax=Thiomicrorhabdus aquaedulcis TaxID=2211106 RepID=UPI000FD76E35|nr:hypothetical protein [Thiomicrorhabdus aquaedulcis]
MFTQKDTIHPTVQYIRDAHNLTWKGLGKVLDDKMAEFGYSISLSPANVRNFATSRSNAWWFWPRISEMVIKDWDEKRDKAESPDELKNIDLNFSELFSEDLKVIYGLWHIALTVSEEKREECKIFAGCMALSNSIINSHEIFFGCKFPGIPGFRQLNLKNADSDTSLTANYF